MDKQVELLFIPSPGLSHLMSTVEAAKLLLLRDGRLSVTVLITRLPNDAPVARYMRDTSTPPRLRLLDLPDRDDEDEAAGPPPSHGVAHASIERQTARVREIIITLIGEKSSAKLAGVVVDMFCTMFIDVAGEFGIPSYVFFTSGAAALGIAQHLVSLRFEHGEDLTQYKKSDVELSVPYFRNPVPAKVLPVSSLGGGPVDFMKYFKKVGEANGIMINTFYELESYVVDSLLSDGRTPKVYPVGPVLNRSGQSLDNEVQKWLDEQPEKSVIFLCFGTMGNLAGDQVREIALALENGGFRFLWSLRKGGEEYESFDHVLPEGFLERTAGAGKVVGWAAQVAALSHAAVGGFVSHCGWNSILESVWFGVPIATFPLYAEQQMNAFELAEELGMAEVVRLDYKMGGMGGGEASEAVGWEEIAAAMRRLMAAEGVGKKVEEMRRKGRAALEEGGSSYKAQALFIEDVISNITA